MTQGQRPQHVVVIGGGIAGLAAAQTLLSERPELAVTVLEGSTSVGGKLRLGTIAGQPVDLGAESLLNRRPEATALAAAVGLSPDIDYPATTSAALWSRGRLQPLPPSVFGIPAGSALSMRHSVLTRRGVARARLERLLPAPTLKGDVAVGALVKQRLGREVRDRLVEPMLGGVYAGSVGELSFAATLPQVHRELQSGGGLLRAAERVRLAQPQSGAREPVFAGISGGVGRLALAVAADVARRGGQIRRSATVRALGRTDSGWWLVLGPTVQPEQVLADAVIVAVPAFAAGRLLSGVVPDGAAELSSIEYASMAIVTLAFRAGQDASALSGSGFLVPPVERRTVKAATFSSQKWSWMRRDTLVVRCSIGRHREEEELQREDGELIDVAVMDLRMATGIRAPVVDAVVTRWGGALPQYAVGHLDRVKRIRTAVADVSGLEVCGAAFDGVGIPAVIATGQQAAARVLRSFDTRATMKA